MDINSMRECKKRVELKNFVEDIIAKLYDIVSMNPENITISEIKNSDSIYGWTAILKSKEMNYVLTVYSKECWKIETFPLYSVTLEELKEQARNSNKINFVIGG